jgi:uncharacterized membrane protein YbhN (UPF0104 family)
LSNSKDQGGRDVIFTFSVVEVGLPFSLLFGLRTSFEQLDTPAPFYHYLPGINIAAFIMDLSGYSRTQGKV